ncbi:UNKNOWN [Stylonychia lemnae]|uniref:Uncharacterized protein n=1 Tax=Stylonychia lemnae TaxID=5949 RepID=A0A078ATS1_STYLE|nr:UNKNOWN [Stylonychia lemnae]|eukprot:CDW84243.1 UNKNOWN [Stylonychia lemnae]
MSEGLLLKIKDVVTLKAKLNEIMDKIISTSSMEQKDKQQRKKVHDSIISGAQKLMLHLKTSFLGASTFSRIAKSVSGHDIDDEIEALSITNNPYQLGQHIPIQQIRSNLDFVNISHNQVIANQKLEQNQFQQVQSLSIIKSKMLKPQPKLDAHGALDQIDRLSNELRCVEERLISNYEQKEKLLSQKLHSIINEQSDLKYIIQSQHEDLQIILINQNQEDQ